MRILALNSGTSRDGVCGVILETQSLKAPAKIKLLAQGLYPYPLWLERLIQKIEQNPNLELLSRGNFLLGEFFAECALRLLKKAKMLPEKIDLIASHGQTVGHFPTPRKIGNYLNRASLQMGEFSVIASRTGITTVGDFRSADIGAGGEGAPVLSYPEYLLFYSPKKNRMVLNLGGIANFSLIPKTGEISQIKASDCGPCNLLLDGLVKLITKGRLEFDPEGKIALKGSSRKEWVNLWLNHPFFKKPAPKTTGKDEFGPSWIKKIMKRITLKGSEEHPDWLRSGVCAVAEMVSRCYFDNYQNWAIEEIIVSGGGTRNEALIMELENKLGQKMILSDRMEIPVLAKEPIGFGILAQLCLEGQVSSVPGATGAKIAVILGKIAPGKNWSKLLYSVRKEKRREDETN